MKRIGEKNGHNQLDPCPKLNSGVSAISPYSGMASKERFELETSPSGETYLRMDRLNQIGIANIADLKSYNMSRVGDRFMHIMEFANGGTLEVTLRIVGLNKAQVEVFKGKDISLQRLGDDLFVRQMTAASAASAPDATILSPVADIV